MPATEYMVLNNYIPDNFKKCLFPYCFEEISTFYIVNFILNRNCGLYMDYFVPNLNTVTKSYSLPAFNTQLGNSGLLQESG